MANEKFIFKVGSTDYSGLVLAGSLGWSKDDIDSEASGRSKVTGDMRRKRLAKKRQLDVTCRRGTYAQLHALAVALDAETVEITYLDLIEGQVTKTFYGTKIESVQYGNLNNAPVWDKMKFTLTEV